MAIQVLIIIIQVAGSNFLVFHSNTFSLYNLGVSKLLHSEADLGFTAKRTNLSIESLMQGVWGTQPLRSYRVFNFA